MDREGYVDGTFNTNFLKLSPADKEKNLALAKAVPFSETNVNLKHFSIRATCSSIEEALPLSLSSSDSSDAMRFITSVDHWIAFFLLLFIGGKMVIEAVRDKDVQEIGAKDLPLDHKEMLLLAVATSIDALAVGITFAFLNVSIMEACLIIGCTTFVLSVIGVVVGNFFGTRYKRKAEIAGGVILILIGLKILLEHLGVIAF